MKKKRFLARCSGGVCVWPLLLVIVLAIASPLLALDPKLAITQYGLSNWKTSDGLPQNSVEAIAQTHDGYLWFGTQEGLVRFDGVRFTVFEKRSLPETNLHRVVALLAARDGSLWIGHYSGLLRYKDGVFINYTKRGDVSDDIVWSLGEGLDGSIWIGTYTGGLIRFKDKVFTRYTTAQGLPGNSINAILPAKDGSLWIGTNGSGLSHYRDGKFTNFSVRDGLSDNLVWAVHEDEHRDIWVGTNNGLDLIHEGRRFSTKFTTANGLSNNSIRVITEDRDGSLWVGTDGGGLNRYANGSFSKFGTADGLSDNSVSSILEDREGSLWVGTQSGGINQLRPGKFKTITTIEGLAGNLVWAVLQASDGSVWVGTSSGASHLKDGQITNLTVKNGLASNFVRTLTEARDGAIWFGTNAGLSKLAHGRITSYHTRDGLAHDAVRTVSEDREGNLWIGSRGGGLTKLRDGVFTRYRDSPAGPTIGDVVPDAIQDSEGAIWIGTMRGVVRMKDGVFKEYRTNTVQTIVIHEDGEGTKWIGTYGGGIFRLKNEKLSLITAKNGLFDDVAYAIVEDQDGYFWITCNRGVYRVSRKQLNDFADGRIASVHFDSYGSADGMRSDECNGGKPGAWKMRNGDLWFATANGIAIIDPRRILVNTVAPGVWNEEVVLDGKVRPLADGSTTIPPGARSLEFHYTALSFIAPQKVLFRYRLKGFDEQWIDAGNRRVAYYMNLPPGRYTFEVMGSNNDGVWAEARNALQIQALRAFYQTWWFFAAAIVVLVAAGLTLFKFRLTLVRAESRLRTAELERNLAQAQKMESLGQMAAGIAHDFNNTMMGALPWTDLIRIKYPSDPVLSKAGESIRSAILRAKEVTQPLLEFASPKRPNMTSLRLVKFVEDQLVMLRPSLPPEIEIEVGCHEPDLAVSADPTQITQAIVNLALNARDAMPDGGKLLFEIRKPSSHEAQSWAIDQDGFVVLAVSDTGSGMDHQTSKRVFDPFFTTKDIGRGTGLGLAIVHRIVEQHRGKIFLESRPRAGTTFYLVLPRVAMPAGIVSAPAPQRARGRLLGINVMLIDDEVQICEGVRVVLELEGAIVSMFHRGTTALRALDEHAPPDLIVLDLGLPEMSGEQVYEAIRPRFRDLPVIIASGYGEAGRKGLVPTHPFTRFQKKPYEMDALIATFFEMISRETIPLAADHARALDQTSDDDPQVN